MKRMIVFCAAFVVLLGASFAAAQEYEITFNTTEFPTKMKPEELEQVKTMVREAYPAAVDMVAATWGDEEKARDAFKTLTITIRDSQPSRDYHGTSQAWWKKTKKNMQNITIVWQSILLGQVDLTELLAHEMLHVTFELQQEVHQFADTPGYIHEGLSYYGSGAAYRRIVLALNQVRPEYELDEVWKDKDFRFYARERTFVECFGRVYGDEARRKFLDSVYRGGSGSRRWNRRPAMTRRRSRKNAPNAQRRW
ncbi:MAG: hypothetical protein M5R36_07240 [Deltaproteobacteria bacterium]|nr:hypothetical protein [Deltaproteobacteria bacterium]